MQSEPETIIDIIDSNNRQLPTNLTIEKNDNIQYIFLLSDDFDKNFNTERLIEIGENAESELFFCYFGQKNIVVCLHFKINRGARVNYHSIFFSKDNQKLYFNEKYQFVSTDSFGRFHAQGLVVGEATSKCAGNIIINPGAQRIDARLEMSSYIIGGKAKSEMAPSLQIEANDVKVGHSGKVSQLGKEELFYLQSRGLSEQQAKQLFIEGLFFDFVKNIENEEVKEKILAMAKKRMGK